MASTARERASGEARSGGDARQSTTNHIDEYLQFLYRSRTPDYRCSPVRSSMRHAISLRRALGGALAMLASAFAVGLLMAPGARATPLPPSLSPLPGSSFQGADGNQGDAQPALDWQAFQAAGRVHHSPDPSAQDTAFTGGSKEDQPGQWGLTTEAGGVNPGKANILDAWSSFDPQGANAFLYLGFAREAASLLRVRPRAATTFITFELNHDPRLWDNGQATIPCRSTGDVLVSYEAQGNQVSVVIQRWVTTLTDPASGCATTGRLDDATGLRPNVDAQGAVNETDIPTYLPGAYTRGDPQRTLRRDGIEPRPGPRTRVRRALLRVQLGLDALALLRVRIVEHAGLRGAGAAHRAELLGVGDEVPRPQRQRSARRGRAWTASVGDLGRLRQRWRARRQRAVCAHG